MVGFTKKRRAALKTQSISTQAQEMQRIRANNGRKPTGTNKGAAKSQINQRLFAQETREELEEARKLEENKKPCVSENTSCFTSFALIPVIEDRAKQTLAKMALEPEWEARFEPNSYGGSIPGRSFQDALPRSHFISHPSQAQVCFRRGQKFRLHQPRSQPSWTNLTLCLV